LLLLSSAAADLETAYHTKLTLDWRTGVAATDWDTIAKKEHLDQLSVEMRKVEGAIREIYAEMLQLQQREQEMRDLNGKCPAGFYYWSLASVLFVLPHAAPALDSSCDSKQRMPHSALLTCRSTQHVAGSTGSGSVC
jgi:hypothetical protein